jgi:hypothetical protein
MDESNDEHEKDCEDEKECEDTKNDLSILLKSFNRLDNYVAKYIYKKYIYLAGLEPSQINFENFLKTIFNIDRPRIITQKESLESDLYKMDIADKAYDKDPKKFKLRQYESVPDVKRCSFIRKHKNKYKRCNINVMNDDSDICYKHIDSPNIYWDRYCEVLDEIKKIEI